MKYQKIKAIVAATCLLLVLPSMGMCTDFNSMTTEELSALRGTMYNAPQEERDEFRAVWRKRIDQMSADEKEKFLGPGGGRGKGSRSGDGLGDGSGRGRGGGGMGASANDNGQGKGQRTGSK